MLIQLRIPTRNHSGVSVKNPRAVATSFMSSYEKPSRSLYGTAVPQVVVPGAPTEILRKGNLRIRPEVLTGFSQDII